MTATAHIFRHPPHGRGFPEPTYEIVWCDHDRAPAVDSRARVEYGSLQRAEAMARECGAKAIVYEGDVGESGTPHRTVPPQQAAREDSADPDPY